MAAAGPGRALKFGPGDAGQLIAGLVSGDTKGGCA
jgi:hypothetical protein